MNSTHIPEEFFDKPQAMHPLDQRDPGDENDWKPADLRPHPVGVKMEIRTFESGATRDTDDGKLDYEGFLHPLVLKRFGEYMHRHRHQKDGTLRSSDNWQKGIPTNEYVKSLLRHVHDVWLWNRGMGEEAREGVEEALCAILFNAQGVLYNREVERKAPSNRGELP